MKKFTLIFVFAVLASLFFGGDAFGQIAVRGSSSNSTTGTSLSITHPSGLAVGDVMIANIVQADNNDNQVLGNTTIPSGWALVNAGSQFAENGNNSWWSTVLYKVATQADVTAGSTSFGLNANTDAAVGGITAYTNVSASGVGPNGSGTGPFDVAVGALQTSGNATGTTITCLGITTATANAGIVMLGMAGNNVAFSGWGTAAPGSLSLTQGYEEQSNDNPDESVSDAFVRQTAAGATGNGSVTIGSARNAGMLIALRQGPAAATLAPAGTKYILTGGSINLTATAVNFAGTGNTYGYAWTATGSTTPAVSATNQPNTNAKSFTYNTAGTYTVKVAVTRSTSSATTNSVTVIVANVPSAPNLWATSSDGTRVSAYTVVNGIYINGPTNIFTPTFPGTTTGGANPTTAALGRNDKQTAANGNFYWLPNSSNNAGVVEVFASKFDGTGQTRIGSIDLNGTSGTSGAASLGFVRLGMSGDGTGWILAGDGSTLYLASFPTPSNGTIGAVTITTKPVSLTGGAAATFQNGDVCIDGNNKMFALGNDGSGVTQIFIGSLSGASVVLDKKWDLLDGSTNANFTGTVNGVAFDVVGSLYISTGAGLYFIDQNTVNTVASGTVTCSLVDAETGLQDLASNFFPAQSTFPVTLLSFTGSFKNTTTRLTWETENIQNFSRFEIERSANGTSFSSIGTQAVAPNLTTRTAFTYNDDLSAVAGKVFYYRLKMIDLDGKTKYSNVILVRKETLAIDGIRISPNPVVSGATATVRFEAAASTKVDFKVVDQMGRVVLTQQNSVTEGTNSVPVNNLDRLVPGMYLLQMNDGAAVQTTKFTIVR